MAFQNTEQMAAQVRTVGSEESSSAGAPVGAAPGREPAARATSLEKALDLCEVLSSAERGLSIRDLARLAKLPPPTVHRLLGALKRRGFVRQDEETSRYRLTLKMLDLSFRLLGRSELRLHAYPVLREFVLRTGARAFVAAASSGEVTYVWPAGPDEVAMHTTYGREMPGHCALYFNEAAATRRLSCLKLSRPQDAADPGRAIVRLGSGAPGTQRLNCTCAPVFDYTGREVARVGVFGHAQDEGRLLSEGGSHAWGLARDVSLRLGHLPVTLPVTA
jgi:DNA-binding transcriptional ArsR family regulator